MYVALNPIMITGGSPAGDCVNEESVAQFMRTGRRGNGKQTVSEWWRPVQCGECLAVPASVLSIPSEIRGTVFILLSTI